MLWFRSRACISLKKREIFLGELVLWMSCEGEVFDKSSEREQRERETEVRGLG
jgi:hypothetical protein